MPLEQITIGFLSAISALRDSSVALTYCAGVTRRIVSQSTVFDMLPVAFISEFNFQC